MKKTRKVLPALLLALVVAIPIAYSLETSLQANEQASKLSTISPAPDKEEQLKEANKVLLEQTANNVSYPQRPQPHFRKDSWQWFWNEQAHISQGDLDWFFGNTFISHWMQNLTNDSFIPSWNAAMQYDFARALFLTLVVGFVLGVETIVCLAVLEFFS